MLLFRRSPSGLSPTVLPHELPFTLLAIIALMKAPRNLVARPITGKMVARPPGTRKPRLLCISVIPSLPKSV